MTSAGDAYCVAGNIVRNYAKICSVANVEALARQAEDIRSLSMPVLQLSDGLLLLPIIGLPLFMS